jgi:hypothetical protein
MTTGLVASIAGLMFVRFMLIRSVSLQLLARIGDVADGACRHEISERMNDMRTLRLVRVANDRNTLTLAGRFVAEVAASVYYIFGIET